MPKRGQIMVLHQTYIMVHLVSGKLKQTKAGKATAKAISCIPANFTFYHQTAKIVVHVRNSGIVAGKTGLCMKVGNDNIYIDGELVTQVNNVYIWTSGDTQGTITPYTLGQQRMSDGTTSLVSFGALVIPQTISEGLILFSFTVDGQTYTYTVPTGGITWKNGTEYTYNVTIIGEAEVVVNSVTQGNWGDGGSYDLSTQ